MKKLILSIFLVFVTAGASFAATAIKVISQDNYTTADPKNTFKVKTINSLVFEDGYKIENGTTITGRVVKVKNATRGKRDAYFDFYPIEFNNGNQKTKIETPKFIARVYNYEPIDKKGLVETAGKAAAGLIVSGASQGISFLQGVTSSEDGENRVASGLKKVYKDSPLSYVEKGDELNIKKGDEIYIKVYSLTENTDE